MLPEILAQKIKEQVLYYLRSTFDFKEDNLRKAFEEFIIDPEFGIAKGPWVDFRFPFRKSTNRKDQYFSFGEVPHPYIHQDLAWGRIREGKHTIVTTGTGSGKTECFLYPLLEYALEAKTQGKQGIKAIVLYPMNALATDQEKRFAKTISQFPKLKEAKITVGTYTGRSEKRQGRKVVSEDGGITDHDTLKRHPPDILLTNYKMLDFLLMRPTDRGLWEKNSPDTLKYLVLDELHTYDGAQGTDVACLIRRLKSRLEVSSNSLCFIGTSATLDSGDDKPGSKVFTSDMEEAMDTPRKRLADFASTLSGETIEPNAILLEDRLTASEMLSESKNQTLSLPNLDSLLPYYGESKEDYCSRQSTLWKAPNDPIELGHWLEHSDLYNVILTRFDEEKKLGKTPWEWNAFTKEISLSYPTFRTLNIDQVEKYLFSFLSLFHFAKRKVGNFTVPFLPMQVQLWIREMRRIGRSLDNKDSKFLWLDELPNGIPALPAYHCRDCGNSGWVGLIEAGTEEEIGAQFGTSGARFTPTQNTAEIYRKFFEGGDKHRSQYIVLFRDLKLDDEILSDPTQNIGEFDPNNFVFLKKRNSNRVTLSKDSIPVLWDNYVVPQDETGLLQGKQVCPDCGSYHGPMFIGTQSATLASVGIDELFGNPLNENPKLLAFTDSVQDASHRAGFFSSRSFLFTLRSLITKSLTDKKGKVSFHSLPSLLLNTAESMNPTLGKKNAFATLLPPDWDDMIEWQKYKESNDKELPATLFNSIVKQLNWSILQEYASSYFQGRSLDWSASSVLFWEEEFVENTVEKVHVRLEQVSPLFRKVEKSDVRLWIYGILNKCKSIGAVDHDFMREYAKSPFWTKKGHRIPQFLSKVQTKQKESLPIFSEFQYKNWFDQWMFKSLKLSLIEGIGENERSQLKALFIEQSLDTKLLVRLEGQNNQEYYLVTSDHTYITTNVSLLKCDKTKKNLLVPSHLKDLWLDHPSMEFHAKEGIYKEATLSDRQKYYKDRYQSNLVRRVVAEEHTGLLATKDREDIEEGFIKGQLADEPNILACTSTLEMGIDIGDLSATLLCSVPPTTANYLQRVGRAGRSTGSALILAIVNQKPHDLFFYARPMALLKGKINAPGCWLDAPSVLSRQFLGFCMDQATKNNLWDEIPGIVKKWIEEWQDPESQFGRFMLWLARDHKKLFDQFNEFFRDISDETRIKLEQDCSLEKIQNLFREIYLDIVSRNQMLNKNIESINSSLKRTDLSEEQKNELNRELKHLQGRKSEMLRMTTLELWTNEGVLPNYAFPERGVLFEGTIYNQKNDVKDAPEITSKTYTLFRPASAAIKELAPWNQFYIGKKQFEIQRLQIRRGDHDLFEAKSICGNCGYLLDHITETKETPDKCPQCGYLSNQVKSLGEMSQMKRFLPFHKSGAISVIDATKGFSGDQDEERQRGFYHTTELFDSTRNSSSPSPTIGNILTGFGIEFLDKLKVREINGGYLQEVVGDNNGVQFHQLKVMPEGFRICTDCGAVLPQAIKESKILSYHSSYCKHKQKIENAARKSISKSLEFGFENAYLYRELESEAIRLILPKVNIENLPTLEACIRYGLRLKFKGTPAHILISLQAIPDPDRIFTRYYLVLMDGVPGGTGFLKALFYEKGPDGKLAEGIIDVFRQAEIGLRDCDCEKEEILGIGTDGCYRCIRTYQQQYEADKISRNRGLELLRSILEAAEKRETISSLDQLDMDEIYESQLEQGFITKLKNIIREENGSWKEISSMGTEIAQFSIPGNENITWLLSAQKTLGLKDGLSAQQRPDFILEAKGTAFKNLKKIAIYIDGFNYHRWKINSISSDIEKRQDLLLTKDYIQITFPSDLSDRKEFLLLPHLPEELVNILSNYLDQKYRKNQNLKLTNSSPFGLLKALLRYPNEETIPKFVNEMVGLIIAYYQKNNIEPNVISPNGYFSWVFNVSGNKSHVLIIDDINLLKEKSQVSPEEELEVKSSWQNFWWYADLLQFVPNVTWKCVGDLPGKSEPMIRNEATPNIEWNELLNSTIESLKGLARILQRENIELPISNFELPLITEDLMAEWAWPKKKVALLCGEMNEYATEWENSGWKTVSIKDTNHFTNDDIAKQLLGILGSK